MSKFNIFCRLAKFDEKTGEFEAVAADETLDKAKEIFDYDTSKDYFLKWSGDIEKATDGKSVGNVRAMHGKSAAGKLTKLICDDAAKAIVVTGKVVDAGDREKMAEGVYTGVSIGGSYVKRWADENVKGAFRYTANPAEISLVDNPCNPNAHFTMVKADGVSEERAFAKVADAGAAQPSEPVAKADDGGKKGDAEQPDDGKAAADASTAADGASAEADEKDTPTAHAQAADAHDKAKEAHTKAGNKKTAATHGKLAAFHRQAAKDKMPQQKSAEEESADKAARAAALKAALLDPELTNGKLEKLAAEHLPADQRTGTTIEIMKRLGELAGITADDAAKAAAREDVSASDKKRATEEYGDVKFADETNKKYPIDTAAHIRAAWNYINKSKNAAKYSADEVKAIKGKIVAAWKAKIDADGPPSAAKVMESALEKDWCSIPQGDGTFRYMATGLDAVACFASLVQSIWNAAEQCKMEQEYEGDTESGLPLRLEALAVEAGEILCEMVEEETQEEAGGTAKSALVGALRKRFVDGHEAADMVRQVMAKAGARHSKEDLGRLQKIHDHSVEMGADCSYGKAAGGDLAKFKEAGTELLAIGKLCGCTGDAPLDAITKAVTVLADKAAKWDAAPAAPRGMLSTITKGVDALPPTAREVPAEVQALIEKAQNGTAEEKQLATMRLAQMVPMVGAPVPAARPR